MSDGKLFQKLDQIEAKYEELTQQLSSPDVLSDSSRYQKLARTHADLAAVVAHPAAQAEFGGFAVHEPAKADALHAAADDEVNNHRKIQCRRVRGGRQGTVTAR